jgi:homoserine dehydrogenase
MSREGLSFADALKGAQEKGYAEADPSLDINGGDAGHKLLNLLKIIFGIEAAIGDFPVTGIEGVSAEDTRFAREMDAAIKLICFAKKVEGGVCAAVRPMMCARRTSFPTSTTRRTPFALPGDTRRRTC